MSLSFCSISSGSKGNCYLVKSDNTNILIDAGISIKKIEASLKEINLHMTDINGILITHEHSDHIRSIASLYKKYNIPLYANNGTFVSMGIELSLENINCFETRKEFCIGEIKVKSFNIDHDAKEPVGYSLFCKDTQVSTLTDVGQINIDMLNEIKDADILILEANHDIDMLKIGRYPWFLKQRILGNKGHLSNEQAGKALVKVLEDNSKPRQILLAHLSQENNFPEMAYQTVKNILEENNFYIGKDILLDTIRRDELSRIYSLPMLASI